MVDYLNGGGFSGSSLVSAYEGGETGIQTLIEDLFASKLLEATWRAQGAFIIFIPNVVKDCAKWKTNAGNNGERRLCAPEGMYLLNAYAQGKGLYQPPGMDPTTVKSWSHYNIGEDVPSPTNLNQGSLLILPFIRYPRSHPEQRICISGTRSWPKRQYVRLPLRGEQL